MDKAMQRRHKIRDKSFFFVWMACLLFTLFFIGYFFFLRTSEVDVTQHVVLEYSGESGSASVEVRSEEISVNQRLQDFYDSLEFTVTPSEGLSNGDEITITADYDSDLAQQYHLEPINLTRTVKVEGLPNRYGSISDIPQELLDGLSKHADAYLDKHMSAILDNDFTDFYSMDDVKLENTETVYQAFMKSKTSENSDRLIVIYRLQASGQVNRSDEQEELQEERSSIYYMVVFPSINDSGVIPDASAYGEKVLLSSEPDEKALDQALKTYLENKGRGGYQIEAITSREEAAVEDGAASDDQQEKQADQAENE